MPDRPFPLLATPRLRLREMTAADVPAIRTMLMAPEVTRHSDWPDAPSEARVAGIVRRFMGHFAGDRGCAWVIEDIGDGGFVGAIRINWINAAWRCGGIGYESHPRHWGRGLMTEALRAVAACAHADFKLNRLEAWTLPGNGASDRVLEKAGFQHEGTHRQQAFFKKAFHDFRIFARLADDPLPAA